MSKSTSNKKMRDYPASYSFRLGTVIQGLVDTGYTLSGLATKSGVPRRSLQKIRDGEEAPSPESLGRLCAVVSKQEAAELITAYLEDVQVRVVNSQASHRKSGSDGAQS